MEIVDEIMTPGCPQCAIKHLSAALSYLADGCELTVGDYEPLVARACINLSECAMGYRSHLHFAIGLLERAESLAVASGWEESAPGIRDVRVSLVRSGETAVPEAVRVLTRRTMPGAFVWAHLEEAKRELDIGHPVELTEASILGAIGEIRKNYMMFPEEDDPKGKGGEEVMACCKKAAKAACKGGKCAAPAKKAPAKGKGKCKK